MKMLGRMLLLVCLVASLGGIAGCGKAEDKIAEEVSEKLIEGSTGNDVEIDDDGVTIESEDGSTLASSQSGELPEDFPEDVPVPEGVITSSLKTEDNFTVSIESEDAALDVYNWCLEESKDEGWTISTEFKAEDGGTIAAKKDGNVLQYTMTQEDDKTMMIVFTGAE